MPETGLGLLGVDWKERIDFAKMRTERVEKAKQALKAAEVDAVFFFRLEDNFLVTDDGCEVISKFYFEERLLQ